MIHPGSSHDPWGDRDDKEKKLEEAFEALESPYKGYTIRPDDAFKVATKDPGKQHFFLSIIKSVLRLLGCVVALIAIPNVEFAIIALASTFLLAELVGILEEL